MARRIFPRIMLMYFRISTDPAIDGSLHISLLRAEECESRPVGSCVGTRLLACCRLPPGGPSRLCRSPSLRVRLRVRSVEQWILFKGARMVRVEAQHEAALFARHEGARP